MSAIRGFRLVVVLTVLVIAPSAAQGPARLTLDEAIRLALANSPSLQAARLAVDEAVGGVKEAKGPRYPSLTADGSVIQYQEPMIVYPLHALDLTNRPVFDQTLLQGSLSLGYTLFDGGIRGGRVDQARAAEGVARDQMQGSEQGVLASTVRAYSEVLTAATILSAQQQRATAFEAETARVKRFLAEGRAARVEQLRAEAALAQARADLATAVARLGLAEANLARILGVEAARARAANLVPVTAVDAAVEPRDTLIAEARRASPQLRAAAGRVAAAKAAEQAAGAAWWPTVRLEGRLVTYGSGGSGSQTEWQAGARLSYPIFSGGSRSAAADRAGAARREAEALYRDVDLALVGRVDQVLAGLTEARDRVVALESAVTQWTEVVRTEALALDQGAGTQTDYLRAESDLALGRASLAQARAGVLVTSVDLTQALGLLTPEAIQRIVAVAH